MNAQRRAEAKRQRRRRRTTDPRHRHYRSDTVRAAECAAAVREGEEKILHLSATIADQLEGRGYVVRGQRGKLPLSWRERLEAFTTAMRSAA